MTIASPQASQVVLVGAGAFALVVIWTFFLAPKNRSGRLPGAKIIVRCRDGHLFTTVWIPFVSFKAVRVGAVRIQHCPVGDHVTSVVPVDPSSLSEADRRFAADHPDSLVP